jgi:hypothetical protein
MPPRQVVGSHYRVAFISIDQISQGFAESCDRETLVEIFGAVISRRVTLPERHRANPD